MSKPSFFADNIKGLVDKTEKLRASAYKAKRYALASELQEIRRHLYRLQVSEAQYESAI
jgi:hypothetical protein